MDILTAAAESRRSSSCSSLSPFQHLCRYTWTWFEAHYHPPKVATVSVSDITPQCCRGSFRHRCSSCCSGCRALATCLFFGEFPDAVKETGRPGRGGIWFHREPRPFHDWLGKSDRAVDKLHRKSPLPRRNLISCSVRPFVPSPWRST